MFLQEKDRRNYWQCNRNQQNCYRVSRAEAFIPVTEVDRIHLDQACKHDCNVLFLQYSDEPAIERFLLDSSVDGFRPSVSETHDFEQRQDDKCCS